MKKLLIGIFFLLLTSFSLCFKASYAQTKKDCGVKKDGVYGTCPMGHPAINNYGECDVPNCPFYRLQ